MFVDSCLLDVDVVVNVKTNSVARIASEWYIQSKSRGCNNGYTISDSVVLLVRLLENIETWTFFLNKTIYKNFEVSW